MEMTYNLTGWSGLLLGLFALFAGAGALRKPGVWRTMVDEIEKSPALQLLSGLTELITGALIYLINPWFPPDWFACVMKAIGGFMMIEALAVIGFSDVYFQFWLRNLVHVHRAWAWFSVLLGVALSVGGMMHFH